MLTDLKMKNFPTFDSLQMRNDYGQLLLRGNKTTTHAQKEKIF